MTKWSGKRCTGRCWFAYYGWVGSSSPTCRRCGRPNPRYRPEDDPHAELNRHPTSKDTSL